jgi:hypothetical protein
MSGDNIPISICFFYDHLDNNIDVVIWLDDIIYAIILLDVNIDVIIWQDDNILLFICIWLDVNIDVIICLSDDILTNSSGYHLAG